MKSCLSTLKQLQPLLKLQGAGSVSFLRGRKDKVVFVMGATGTGKSRLAIDLATRFPAEIINCDKIQVYKGLDILTNKVTLDECRGVPHHLLGTIDPNTSFTCLDFQRQASKDIESVIDRDRIPIIAGGSNSFIRALVNDCAGFGLRYQCCFLWVDVSMPVLHSFVSERVDQMVGMGLVDEVRGIFDPTADYTVGIRRAIGVPELDQYLRSSADDAGDEEKNKLMLDVGIAKIKENTFMLACRQLKKIQRLYKHWNMHRIDATDAFLLRGKEAEETWERLVAQPTTTIIDSFLCNEDHLDNNILLPDTAAVAAAAAFSR